MQTTTKHIIQIFDHMWTLACFISRILEQTRKCCNSSKYHWKLVAGGKNSPFIHVLKVWFYTQKQGTAWCQKCFWRLLLFYLFWYVWGDFLSICLLWESRRKMRVCQSELKLINFQVSVKNVAKQVSSHNLLCKMVNPK